MTEKPYIIAIAGPSCTGKTALALSLMEQLGHHPNVLEPVGAHVLHAVPLFIPDGLSHLIAVGADPRRDASHRQAALLRSYRG